MEVRAVDAEPGGGLRHVPVRSLERAPDRIGFAALDLATQPHAVLRDGSGLEPRRQILRAHLRALDQNGRALHEIPQLTYVARPSIFLEDRERFGGESLRWLPLRRAKRLEK